MRDFLGYVLLGEGGLYSNWSIMHFLSGFVPHALYAYLLTDAAHWISLYVLTFAACVFELVENTEGARTAHARKQPVRAPTDPPPRAGSGKFMWSWIGYNKSNYRIDSLHNSVADILFLLLGWLVVEVVHLATPSMTALYALLGVAGALLVLFVVLFLEERQRWRAVDGPATATGAAALPALTALAW